MPNGVCGSIESSPSLETPAFETLLRRAGLFLVLLLSLAIRFPLLHMPLERDEGGHAYAAWVWSEGGVPYRDTVDNKPPLILLLYRASFALFGPTPEAPRLLLILAMLAEIGLLYGLARRRLEEGPSLIAALVFSLLSAEPTLGVGSGANTEAFMLLPLLLGAYCLPSSALLSGVCLGAACMIKQTAFFETVAFGLYLFLSGGEGLGERAKCLARYILGAAMVPGLFAAYFWASGAWREFLYCVMLYNVEYGSEIVKGGLIWKGLHGLFRTLLRLAPMECLAWALSAFGAAWVYTRHRADRWILLWLLASTAGVCSGFRFLDHYFLQAYPALALCAGFGAAALPRAVPVAALAAGLSLPYLWGNRSFFFTGTPEAASRAIYETNPFPEAVKLAEYLRENTDEADRIYVFGSEPEILFYAKRRSATRYIFFYALTGEFSRAGAMQRQALAEVEAARPKYVVWVNSPLSHLAGEKSERFILNESRSLVSDARRYELDGLVFVEKGRPSRYYLGARSIAAMSGEQGRAAAVALYRRKDAAE